LIASRSFVVAWPTVVIDVLNPYALAGIIRLPFLLVSEVTVPDPDPKVTALRTTRTLNPRPHAVRDAAFTQGDPFFDARDLLQVKYEMLRRVLVDGHPVSATAAAFGFSRPSFYAAQAAWHAAGLPGLVPVRPGPRAAHKLTPAVVTFLVDQHTAQPHLRTAELVDLLKEQFGLRVHPRSVERALAQHRKKD
jgi:transposase